MLISTFCLSTCTKIFGEGIHFCGELSFFVFVSVFAAAAATAVAGMTERRIVSDGLLTFSL